MNGPAATLGAGTSLGATELTVSDLDRSIAFYQDALGLRVTRTEDPIVGMGTEERELVVLHGDPAARRPGGRPHAGLFHLALLYPTRNELATALVRLARAGGHLSGAADHGVSEALYLDDPEDNGIELYVDRPRAEWPAPAREGERVGMYTQPLDLEELVTTVRDQTPPRHAPDGLVLGHMHLHIGDLDASTAFYRDVVGLEVMTTYPGAAFLAAGGYHHHLAVNTWAGEGAPPQPPGTPGLREWTLVVDGPAQLQAIASRAGTQPGPGDGMLLLRDPSQNALRVRAA